MFSYVTMSYLECVLYRSIDVFLRDHVHVSSTQYKMALVYEEKQV
jgi:hypothetical protein